MFSATRFEYSLQNMTTEKKKKMRKLPKKEKRNGNLTVVNIFAELIWTYANTKKKKLFQFEAKMMLEDRGLVCVNNVKNSHH